METVFQFKDEKIRSMDPCLYNGRKSPFRIYGLYHPEREGLFMRLPSNVAEETSKKISLLYTNTAGARLRFATDSSFLAVGALYAPTTFPSERTVALSGVNSFCFDLYADGEHCRVLWSEQLIQRGNVMSFDLADGQYEAYIQFSEKKMRQITLCFPSFVNVSDVFIGLEQGATPLESEPYRNEIPICFYGSSITQGACASRSGNLYQNILSRRFGLDYINLGFAGACKAEDRIIDYLCELPMSMLVFDYDHNTPSLEYLEHTHLPALRKLRGAHPEIPFVLLSKPNCHNGREEAKARMEIIRHSAEVLRAESRAPIHFVNGLDIFDGHDSEMMTVDGTHPTDLGFYCMAEALRGIFEEYFG